LRAAAGSKKGFLAEAFLLAGCPAGLLDYLLDYLLPPVFG